MNTQKMNAANVLVYVQDKYPQALQSPVAQSCGAMNPVLSDAVEHANQCIQSADGWDMETLALNIESNFPELDPRQCDDIAAAVLLAARNSISDR